MITFHPTTLEEMRKLGDYDSVFNSIRINEREFKDVLSFLNNASLMKAVDFDNNIIGMLSVEPVEASEVEVHAYVLPEHRKRSRELLGAFKEALFTLTPITSIRTTVTGDFKPLVRFLRFIGFRTVGINRGVVRKNNQVYDLFVLQVNKGD